MTKRDDPRETGERPEEGVLRWLPQAVRSNMEDLAKAEKELFKRLGKDPSAQARFLRDPAGTLKALGLPVSRALEHHLGRVVPQNLSALLRPASVTLPNGQRLTPQVTVTVTEREKEG